MVTVNPVGMFHVFIPTKNEEVESTSLTLRVFFGGQLSRFN